MLYYCRYSSRDATLTSATVHCKRGVNQLFSLASHTLCPGQYTDEELSYSADRDAFPVVIHCVVDEGGEGKHSLLLNLMRIQMNDDRYIF